jgi:hypothetical protein
MYFDLGQVLGIPVKALTFHGKLGLAIGARGVGRAMAHYEPNHCAINLTRKRGVGSFAHEWAHFFDNMLGQKFSRGKKAAFLSTQPWKKQRQEDKISSKRKGPRLPSLFQLFFDEIKPLRERILSKWPEDLIFEYEKRSYWTEPMEMFARCFEIYIQIKLKKLGIVNSFLVADFKHFS